MEDLSASAAADGNTPQVGGGGSAPVLFNNIGVNRVGGALKVNDSGMAWKSKTGKTVVLLGNEIDHAEWVNLGRLYQLRLTTSKGGTYKFDGFTAEDLDRIKPYIEGRYEAELEVVPLSTKGWNWGKVDFQSATLLFNVGGSPAFELPLQDVAQCFVHKKNEVSMEFHQSEKESADAESLVEVRFYIPQDKEQEGENPAATFQQRVMEKADVTSNTGGGLVVFPNTPVLTPRGRYDIEIFPTFLRLHGKTYDYKILFNSIYHLFELPKPDDRYVCFILSVEPPIRQGYTRYPHIVLQFAKSDKVQLTLNLKDTQGKLPENAKLAEEMSGRTYKTFRRIIKELTQMKVTTPGKFKSFHEQSAIKCSLKANDGYLFPLEHSLFFIHKPPTYIRYSEISLVEFARVTTGNTGVSNRTFDVIVMTKGGQDYTFTSIQRQEFTNLYSFLTTKDIKINQRSTMEHTDTASQDNGSDDERGRRRGAADTIDSIAANSESEDEDFVAGRGEAADDDEDPDEEFDEMDAEPEERLGDEEIVSGKRKRTTSMVQEAKDAAKKRKKRKVDKNTAAAAGSEESDSEDDEEYDVEQDRKKEKEEKEKGKDNSAAEGEDD